MIDIGIVVIGRNEGESLQRCLRSVVEQKALVVYADSGSTDQSVGLARDLGASVVVLEASLPFTAARGRNAGFARLVELAPAIKYVQFIDGDCELAPGWLESGVQFFMKYTAHAAVCGRLRERRPEASIYNRLCDIEWNGPTGDIDSCGGVFLIRATAFAEIGGMNSAIAAGEEPEMCLRLRKAGWRIARLDKEMALHDAALLRFAQWWHRVVRGGRGAVDVYKRTDTQVFAPQVKRTLLWTIGWSFALLFSLNVNSILHGTQWAKLPIFAVLASYPVQMARLAVKIRAKCPGWREAVAYGMLMLLGKWAELLGQVCYYAELSRRNRDK